MILVKEIPKTDKRSLTLYQGDFDLLHVWNKEVTTKWIAGLRSGKWVQTTSAMTNIEIPNSACCLMVLEGECNNKVVADFIYAKEIAGIPKPMTMPNGRTDYLVFKHANGDAKLPQDIPALLHSPNLKSTGDLIYPAGWNDNLCLTFEQIADLLEFGQIEF